VSHVVQVIAHFSFRKESDVSIVEVPQNSFVLFKNIEPCRSLWVEAHERAWFSDTSGRVAGVLTCDDSGVWGWSICRLTEDNEYQRVASASGFTDAGRARLDLIACMRETA
jgi:hypothetical protein